MKIVHLDDRMQVQLDRARCGSVIEIPDDSDEPVAWRMDEPIEREGRQYTHVIRIANMRGPDEQYGLPLTTAEAEELARARDERGPR